MGSPTGMDYAEYEALKRYCKTEEHHRRLDLTFELGSSRKAAKEIGCSKNAILQTINVIRKEAARRGYSPDDDRAGTAPPGFIVRGKSTLHGPDGNILVQWVKTREDDRKNWDALVESIQESAAVIEGLAKPVKSPAKVDSDLLAVYPYGDPHVGMYAWHEDAGGDFDLDIAVSLFTGKTRDLIDSAPPAEKALICFLGDFFHADSQSNRTEKSGAQLDVDSRWSKVLRVGINIAVGLIHLALTKHREVHVITERGNHDGHSSVMLAVCLDAFFRNDKRVTVDLSPAYYHYYLFGKNLIATTHGHLAKPAALPGIMASHRPEDWGRTIHRVWYTGHIHTQTRYDFSGCQVESFRILPPADAWTHSMGYNAPRSMDCIIRHREDGEVQRHTVMA